jgi:hypothetical protein
VRTNGIDTTGYDANLDATALVDWQCALSTFADLVKGAPTIVVFAAVKLEPLVLTKVIPLLERETRWSVPSAVLSAILIGRAILILALIGGGAASARSWPVAGVADAYARTACIVAAHATAQPTKALSPTPRLGACNHGVLLVPAVAGNLILAHGMGIIAQTKSLASVALGVRDGIVFERKVAPQR